MAVNCIEQEHVCMVISDHDYMMTLEKYKKQRKEAAKLSKELKFPIICGLEISLWSEEAVLIGSKVCERWLEQRDMLRKLKERAWEFFSPRPSDNHALCLVHPSLRGYPRIYTIFDCYEVMNAGSIWPDKCRELMAELMPQAIPVKGIDAHSVKYLLDPRCECNGVEDGKWNERAVIKWMKSR
jgi:hypothetical protein